MPCPTTRRDGRSVCAVYKFDRKKERKIKNIHDMMEKYDGGNMVNQRNETTGMEPAKGQFLVYQAEDGKLKLDVRLEEETVWLTQPMMAELFQTTQQNISQHIINIYEEEELAPEGTHKKFLSVRREGNREVKRLLDYFNLDMIISVGYRVRSHVATRFRILAINDRNILNHAGMISHEMAKQLAESEYEKFSSQRVAASNKELSDFDKAIVKVETSKSLKTGCKIIQQQIKPQ